MIPVCFVLKLSHLTLVLYLCYCQIGLDVCGRAHIQSNDGRYVLLAKHWLREKKDLIFNMLTALTLWGLWKLRNYLCFQNGVCLGLQKLQRSSRAMFKNWGWLLCSVKSFELHKLWKAKLDALVTRLEQILSRNGACQPQQWRSWWTECSKLRYALLFVG